MAIRQLVLAALAGGSCLLAAPATAQDYPNRPVTIVVPYAAGGGIDVLARQVAQKLTERLGKPFVIENRAGAGTAIGSTYVARAAPDGYTLLFGTSTPFAINATLHKNLPYDPGKDFAPIVLAGHGAFMLLVNPTLPVASVADWIKWVKSQPGKLSYASAGAGSPQHLSMEMLKTLTATDIVHVPYRGGAPALNDLVAGTILTQFSEPTPALPLIAAGKARVLGVSGTTRMSPLPDVPTLDEAGVRGFDFVSWQMIAAPAGTPKDIVDKLYRELKAILASRDILEEYERTARTPVESPPPEAQLAFVRNEIVRLGKVVEAAGIARSQ